MSMTKADLDTWKLRFLTALDACARESVSARDNEKVREFFVLTRKQIESTFSVFQNKRHLELALAEMTREAPPELAALRPEIAEVGLVLAGVLREFIDSDIVSESSESDETRELSSNVIDLASFRNKKR